MSTQKLELAAARAVLGLLASDDLAQVGVHALEEGCDSPSLRMLSGLCTGETDEARRLFDRVLSELGLVMPSKRDAVMRLARETAQEILAGATGAYVGARQIWDLTLRASDERLPELDTFVYGASEWEDRPEDRVAFEEGIVAAARGLVSNCTGPTGFGGQERRFPRR